MANLEDELGDIVAKARRGLGYTLDQLTRLTGTSGRDIGRIEAYQLRPDPEQVRPLAEALRLDPDKLVDIATDAWEPRPARLPQETVVVERIFVPYGAYGANSYIVGCIQTSMAAVVDPGGAVPDILKCIMKHSLTLDLVLITHAHGDHVGGLDEVRSAAPNIRLVGHPLESKSVPYPASARWEAAEDGARIELGNLSISVLHTPGHTPGSTCYHVDGVCFTGDTLFAGSIGRPGGREVYQRMLADIRAKVLSLPDETVLLPGHGPPSTVAEEESHNPFFGPA